MEIIRLSDVAVEEAAKRAAAVLAAGGIVAYPTDTLYGLAADAANDEALTRLRRLKGREARRPISLIVPDVKSIDAIAIMNEFAHTLAERFLPGALTLVLSLKGGVSETLGLNGAIGIRIPNDAFCIALARAFKRPYTATSANLTGLTTPHTVEQLIWHFGPKIQDIDLIIDGGERSGTASTVVSCVDGSPQVLRDGALSRADLGLDA